MTESMSRREFMMKAIRAAAAAAATVAMVSCQTPAATTEAPSEASGGEQAAEPTAAEATEVPAEPAKERVFRMNMPLNRGDQGVGVDPGCSGAYASYPLNYMMFGALVMLDEKLNVIPDMAESWDVSEDGLTYTFHLRDGLVWSDGTPITAVDFEDSIKRNLSPTLYCGGQFWQLTDITGATEYYTDTTGAVDPSTVGVKATDDKTLEVTIKAKASYFIMVATLPAFMALPKASYETFGETWTRPENVLSSGPFILTEWVVDQKMVFVPNPKYHFALPGVDRVEISMITQEATAMAAYEAGELDMVDVPASEVVRVEADPALSQELVVTPELATEHLVIRKIAPFDDARVCHAIACAIDKATLCNTVLPGIGTPAYQFLAPNMLGHDDSFGQELAYNPDKARQLLSDAGFPNGEGWPEEVYFSFGASTTFQTTFEAIQAMIKDVLNINFLLAPGDQTSAGVTLSNPPFKPLISRIMWGADYPDPHNFMVVLYTCPPKTDEDTWKYPEIVYCDEKFDSLVWEASAEQDLEKRRQLYLQCEQELVIDNPKIIPLYYYTRYRLFKPYVKGFILNGNGAPIIRNLSIES